MKKWAVLVLLLDFSSNSVGQFPSDFKTYPFQRNKAMKVYTVQAEDNRHYLMAKVAGETQEIAVQIFKPFDWDLSTSPILSWRWRAKALPSASSENHESFNDNACGVYVVFGRFHGKALKYVWSTDLPVGKVIQESSRFFYTVLQSGPKNMGSWQTVSLNILDEYRRLFKKDPDHNPIGIGILTDGDGSHSPAICDYADFKISARN